MTILTYTLEGCDYCATLLANLEARGISCVNIDADKHPDLADMAELQTNTTYYPIVQLMNGSTNLYFATGIEGNVPENVIEYMSIDHLTHLIETYI